MKFLLLTNEKLTISNFWVECILVPCGNGEGGCKNDIHCTDGLTCGSDSKCHAECFKTHCPEGSGICLNNSECSGSLICGSDNVCQKPCNQSPCDKGEGECQTNNDCTDSICGNNMICRGKGPQFIYTRV